MALRRLAAAALLLLAGLAGLARAGVIAVGQLQSCVNDGTVRREGRPPVLPRRSPLIPGVPCRLQTNATKLECKKKIVVTLDIPNSQLYETEQLGFSVSCVDRCPERCGEGQGSRWRSRVLAAPLNSAAAAALLPAPLPTRGSTALLPACSPSGECPCPCNYATDADCACRDLQQTITVAATKTPVYASYPLTLRKSFNGAPYEVRGAGVAA